MAEIIFERTCNYWIDAGIVGLYDTFNKPVPASDTVGRWPETIKKRAGISVYLTPEHLRIDGEEKHIDLALSYALERIRMTLYDVSTEKQINNIEGVYYNEQEGIVHFPMVKPLASAEIVLESPRYTEKGASINLPSDVLEKLKKIKGALRGKNSKYQKRRNSCLPFFLFDQETTYFDNGEEKLTGKYCVSCGQGLRNYNYSEAKKWLAGESKNFMPFVEGHEANRTFHSYHQNSYKCWQCGFVALFSPLLLFFRRVENDTYYVLPHIPGNLLATNKLYRSLSGKRGLARALGTDLKIGNYETYFNEMPRGIPAFTLSFYYDLWDRLLPKSVGKLLQSSQNIGLIDKRGAVFQTALFLKRDSGQKSFIMRETTIDRSAYFIKLFTYLKQYVDDVGRVLHLLMERTSDFQIIKGQKFRRSQLQRLSVIRATQALTEGRNVYRFLLAILLSDLKEDMARPDDVYQIASLFQKYDQWLFKKEDEAMANMIEQARTDGWRLSQAFWNNLTGDKEEKKSLLRRYYYGIERSPSPVKFLEQVRHAYKKVEEKIPKDMLFHNEDGNENIKKFEVYRVYFLAGMLNGLWNKGKEVKAVIENNNVEEVSNNE
jgi:hypothetical protein